MKRLAVVCSILATLSLAVSSTAFALGENIAKGCLVSATQSSSYGNGDKLPAVLTDGLYANTGTWWTEKNVIGWETKGPVGITIDLGKDQPISGVSFSSICDNSEWVQWPADIQVFISPDSENWRYAGDLLTLSRANGEPSMNGPAMFRFTTHSLQERGRYVRFIVFPHMECFFCDEIEVYRGGDEQPVKPISEQAIKDPTADARSRYFDSRIRYRLDSDAKAVRDAISRSDVSQSKKNQLNAKLDDVEKGIPSVHEESSPSFKAILPINNVDSGIFSVYGALLKSAGLPSLLAWKANRYDLLSVTDVPQKEPTKANISVSMMKNEYRTDAFLLTNASDAPVEARLNIQGLPGGPNPEWLSLYAIPWTDTNLGIPVAAALVPAAYENGQFTVYIPAGMTSKIWLTVDSSKLQSGKYHGKLKVKCPGRSVTVPLDLSISPVCMARPRLSFTEWDYTFVPGSYAITPKNIEAAVDMMRSHFVDSPWARPENLEIPGKEAFDAQGNLMKPRRFLGFDTWLNRWKDARHYLIFLNAPTSIAGCDMGTKEFDVRVENWAKAFGDHVHSLGLKPEQFGIMIRDEPSASDLKIILAWAKPIRAAMPGITIFQDCNNSAAYKTDNEIQAHHLANISCPEIGPFYRGGEENRKFFDGLLSSTHKNWFYQCYGPARLLDPYQYNRLEAWHCFKHGATGMGLWAFADMGAFKDSWNEYTSGGPSYSPVFFHGDDVVSGIHYEGAREGIEDDEYLMMLRDAAQDSRNAAFKSQAEELLKESVDSVLGEKYVSDAKQWTYKNDRSRADICRLRILSLLEKLDLSAKSR